MWNSFEKLAQANLDHYNDNPTKHNVIAAVYCIVAVVAIGWFGKKIATMNTPQNQK